MTSPYFAPADELNKQLQLTSTHPNRPTLARTDTQDSTLPGQPRVQLAASSLTSYVRGEYLTPELDGCVSKLWLVSTPRSSHISPLHHQKARGRTIIPVENPRLHLLWFHDSVYVKPLPRYLLSSAYWQYLQHQDEDLRKATVGFLRTYAYLIRYDSDFRLAQSEALYLIPHDDGSQPITYDRFIRFITAFESLPDSLVSPRWQYGELRLTRLNLLAPLLMEKLTYHHVDAQWSAYLARFLAPFLTVFAVVSVALSAMQVALSAMQVGLAEPVGTVNPAGSAAFAQTAFYFAVLALFFTGIFMATCVSLICFMAVHDVWFAWMVLRRVRKHGPTEEKVFKSGVT